MDKKGAQFLLYKRLHEAFDGWSLDIYGETLREKNRWDVKNGPDAITLYLVNKHHWTVDYCRALSEDALRLVLAEELKAWSIPNDLQEVSDPFSKFLKENPVARLNKTTPAPTSTPASASTPTPASAPTSASTPTPTTPTPTPTPTTPKPTPKSK
jgi:cell division septation protein DedD